MSGAAFAPRDSQPADEMLSKAADNGWDGLEEIFKPHLQNRGLQPEDTVARNLARFVTHEAGREVLEWILDISVRQPYRATGSSLEATALQAAHRQGINGLAEAILSAVAHGNKLIESGEQ